MGIPFFGRWLMSHKFPGAVMKQIPNKVSSLSLDMGGILHQALQETYAYGKFDDEKSRKNLLRQNPVLLKAQAFIIIQTTILRLIEKINPKDVLIISIDGLAPAAKLQQQRQRRYRSSKQKSSGQLFDSNSITPGTEFMRDLDNFLRSFILTQKELLPPKIIYSSHMGEGEGEHKIADYYRSGILSEGPSAQDGGAHILYGLDADLIMIALLSPLPNIYLCREDVDVYFSADNLRKGISQLMRTPTGVEDFTVMMFLAGNDFLPKMVSFDELGPSIDLMIGVYQRLNKSLTVKNEIDWKNMLEFLEALVPLEENLLKHRASTQPLQANKALSNAMKSGKGGEFYFDMGSFRGDYYRHSFGVKGSSEIQYFVEKVLGESNPLKITPEEIETICFDYINGIAWTHLYYLKGTSAVNFSYYYSKWYSPLIKDIVVTLRKELASEERTTGCDTIACFYKVSDETVPRYSPLTQLLAVLPIKSFALFPTEVLPLLSSDSPIIDLFPEEFTVDFKGDEKKDIHSIPLIPHADITRINEALLSLQFSTSEALRWVLEPDITIISNKKPQYPFSNRRNVLSENKILYSSEERGRGRGRGTGRGRGRGRGRGSNREEYGSSIYNTSVPFPSITAPSNNFVPIVSSSEPQTTLVSSAIPMIGFLQNTNVSSESKRVEIPRPSGGFNTLNISQGVIPSNRDKYDRNLRGTSRTVGEGRRGDQRESRPRGRGRGSREAPQFGTESTRDTGTTRGGRGRGSSLRSKSQAPRTSRSVPVELKKQDWLNSEVLM